MFDAKSEEKLPPLGIELCPSCNKNWTLNKELCDECQDIEKRRSKKKTLDLGMPTFSSLFFLAVLIILVVIAFVAYFRLGGFGSSFYQALGIWFVSALIFLLGENLLIPYDAVLMSEFIREERSFEWVHKLNGILYDIFSLYDLEDRSIKAETIIATFLFFLFLAISFVGLSGMLFVIAFLIIRLWDLSAAVGLSIGFFGTFYLGDLIEKACLSLGELEIMSNSFRQR